MPGIVGRSKRKVFLNLKDRVWVRLQSWKCKNLSQMRKAALIKSVIQTMQMFVMSYFLVPNSICQDMEGMMAKFFWHNKGVQKIHWIAWDKICVRKEEGGLGLQTIGLVMARRCVFGRIIRHERYPIHSPYHLMVKDGGGWGTSGASLPGLPSWKLAWWVAVPSKIRLFALKIYREALRTKSRLARRVVWMSNSCSWCGDETEDPLHVLLCCYYPYLIWALSSLPYISLMCNHNSPELWLRGLQRNLDRACFCHSLLVCWFLWLARNKLNFESTNFQRLQDKLSIGFQDMRPLIVLFFFCFWTFWFWFTFIFFSLSAFTVP
ncbi:UNVERIFIED_CONTAM: hypothetical protein Sradi_2053500 [Sesamum radiatum]|uniref:Reverse transcriptase zinc-binding domain-containing protein n=1 Tax=Sesamum radiatum TaxID=300843 RepID=A0AAW2THR2_SESRA